MKPLQKHQLKHLYPKYKLFMAKNSFCIKIKYICYQLLPPVLKLKGRNLRIFVIS